MWKIGRIFYWNFACCMSMWVLRVNCFHLKYRHHPLGNRLCSASAASPPPHLITVISLVSKHDRVRPMGAPAGGGDGAGTRWWIQGEFQQPCDLPNGPNCMTIIIRAVNPSRSKGGAKSCPPLRFFSITFLKINLSKILTLRKILYQFWTF